LTLKAQLSPCTSFIDVSILFLISWQVAQAQPTLERVTWWRNRSSYGLNRHVPVWSPDKLRNGKPFKSSEGEELQAGIGDNQTSLG
jgi:hypothetical protein